MKLIGKKLLIIISDGIEQGEYEALKQGFQRELAEVFTTSPQDVLTIESVAKNRRGRDVALDFPLEAVEVSQFDGLILPDGLVSSQALRNDERTIAIVREFHSHRLPIFASGKAVEILYDLGILPAQILVRESAPLSLFVQQAVEVLLENTPALQVYQSRKAQPTQSRQAA